MQPLYRALLAGLVALAATSPVAAQTRPDAEVPRVTRTFAIENARIVQAPGREIARGTVVVRDGRILAVGTDVRVPFDAERIAGDSLVVYAGFIDALGHAGIAKPKRETNLPRVENPDNPPDERAGRQPHREAAALLKTDDSSIDALRKAGFTLAHTVPHDGFLPGQGALVFLSDRDDARQLVLRNETSLFATWEGARGAYPATPMAIMASWRNLYREAQRRGAVETAYARGPAGRERAPFDPVHQAFQPVIAGSQPVFFYTDEALDAHRALQLSKELGFKVVLAGLAQAHEMTDRLQAAKVPLVLTLALPDPPKGAARRDTSAARADSTAAAKPDSAHVVTPDESFFVSDLRTTSYEDLDREKKNLTARSAQVLQRYEGTAARLHEAGLAFAFSTAEAKPADVHKNLRRMIAQGLPESTALAALTTNAADILGISRDFGTVEAGKVANLVVTSRPIFDEKAQVRMVVVDGERYAYEAKAAPKRNGANGSSTAAGAVGTWSVELPSPEGGTMEGTLTITGTPGALGGTLAVPAMPAPATLEDVTLDGDTLSFSFNAPGFGRISVMATLSGDQFSGTMDVPGAGSLPISGTRTPGR